LLTNGNKYLLLFGLQYLQPLLQLREEHPKNTYNSNKGSGLQTLLKNALPPLNWFNETAASGSLSDTMTEKEDLENGHKGGASSADAVLLVNDANRIVLKFMKADCHSDSISIGTGACALFLCLRYCGQGNEQKQEFKILATETVLPG
jgi:hypothetical protein